MKKSLEKVLDGFKDRKILVVGDIMLDKFSWGEIERVNPEQPAAHLVKILSETYILGGAANIANNISSLGAKCGLYGILGKDENGKIFEELCDKNKITFHGFYEDNPTIVKQRIIAHRQQITRLDYGESNGRRINKKTEEEILELLGKNIGRYEMIVLSDYDKGIFAGELSNRIIEIANLNGIKTIAAPKPENCKRGFFNGSYVICQNKKEAQELTGVKLREDNLVSMGEIISKQTESEQIIITLGESGMFSYDAGKKKPLIVETKAREVADVTGAGDSFVAALALGLSSKLDMHEAAILANYAAGVVVGKVGTATVNIEEIKELLKKEQYKPA